MSDQPTNSEGIGGSVQDECAEDMSTSHSDSEELHLDANV
jgi:hypothetical protein